MTLYEIIGGVILLIAAAAIVFLTLCQQSKGKGLSSAIGGGNAAMGGNSYTSPADRILAKLTKIAGVVFFIGAIVACVLSSRVG